MGSEEHKTHGLPVRTSSPPIPGKLMLCEDGMADDGPQAAELDDAGRLAPLTLVKDVIPEFGYSQYNYEYSTISKIVPADVIARPFFRCVFDSGPLIKSSHVEILEVVED